MSRIRPPRWIVDYVPPGYYPPGSGTPPMGGHWEFHPSDGFPGSAEPYPDFGHTGADTGGLGSTGPFRHPGPSFDYPPGPLPSTSFARYPYDPAFPGLPSRPLLPSAAVPLSSSSQQSPFSRRSQMPGQASGPDPSTARGPTAGAAHLRESASTSSLPRFQGGPTVSRATSPTPEPGPQRRITNTSYTSQGNTSSSRNPEPHLPLPRLQRSLNDRNIAPLPSSLSRSYVDLLPPRRPPSPVNYLGHSPYTTHDDGPHRGHGSDPFTLPPVSRAGAVTGSRSFPTSRLMRRPSQTELPALPPLTQLSNVRGASSRQLLPGNVGGRLPPLSDALTGHNDYRSHNIGPLVDSPRTARGAPLPPLVQPLPPLVQSPRRPSTATSLTPQRRRASMTSTIGDGSPNERELPRTRIRPLSPEREPAPSPDSLPQLSSRSQTFRHPLRTNEDRQAESFARARRSPSLPLMRPHNPHLSRTSQDYDDIQFELESLGED